MVRFCGVAFAGVPSAVMIVPAQASKFSCALPPTPGPKKMATISMPSPTAGASLMRGGEMIHCPTRAEP
jgi:hypothetical protein